MYIGSVIAIVTLFSASLTSATFLRSRDSDTPSCAKGCFSSAPNKACSNDAACTCQNSWLNTLECCVQDACNDRDTSTFNQIVTQVCHDSGVQVAMTCSATPSTLPTSTVKSSSSSSSSAASVSTIPKSSTTASTTAQTTSTTATGASTTPATSTSTTPTTLSSASSSPTTAAQATTTSSANVCTCGGGGGSDTGSTSPPATSITQTTIPPTSSPTSIPPATLSTILSSATATLPAKPTTVPSVGGYTYQGCFTEATNGNRALNETRYNDPAGMTVEKCVAFCQGTGMKWAGVEWSQECWCGGAMEYVNGATKLGEGLDGACNMPCAGDGSEVCGGWAVLGAYQAN